MLQAVGSHFVQLISIFRVVWVRQWSIDMISTCHLAGLTAEDRCQVMAVVRLRCQVVTVVTVASVEFVAGVSSVTQGHWHTWCQHAVALSITETVSRWFKNICFRKYSLSPLSRTETLIWNQRLLIFYEGLQFQIPTLWALQTDKISKVFFHDHVMMTWILWTLSCESDIWDQNKFYNSTI